MSSTPDETTRQAGEICIDAVQLRPGVHVRLIAAMKLPQIFCDPARRQAPPLGPKVVVYAPNGHGLVRHPE